MKGITRLLPVLLAALLLTGWTMAGRATEAYDPESAVLSFSSFDGGGHEYSVEIEDPNVLACASERDYGNRDELEDGSPYWQVFTFTGLKPGTTKVSVYGRSPILDNDDTVYTAVVDEGFNVTLTPVRAISTFFLYRSGDIHYDSYSVTHWADGYHVSVNDGPDRRIDDASVEALMTAVDAFDLARWDGFEASNDFVLDGESFWLEVRLTDGTGIMARGDNAYPEDYFPAVSRLQEILDNARIGPA